MRIAIVSDLHANLPAITAVVEDARAHGASHLICLGDIVGYGPQPVETLIFVRNLAAACVLGNHDAAVCGEIPLEPFNDFAIRTLQRAQMLLDHDQKAWLAARPYLLESEHFACAHSGFADPERFHYLESKADAKINFTAMPHHQLLFVGHTHLPGIYVLHVPTGEIRLLPPQEIRLQANERYIVNPGSVGFPRTDDVDPTYVLYDTNTRLLDFRKVQYNFSAFRMAIVNNGYNLLDYWFLAPNACQQRTVRAFLQPTHISTARLSKAFRPKETAITHAQQMLWVLTTLLLACFVLIIFLLVRVSRQADTLERISEATLEAQAAEDERAEARSDEPSPVLGPNRFPKLMAWSTSPGVTVQPDNTFRLPRGKSEVASPPQTLPGGLERLTVTYTFDCDRADARVYTSKIVFFLQDGSRVEAAKHRYKVPQTRTETLRPPAEAVACSFVFTCETVVPAALGGLSLTY